MDLSQLLSVIRKTQKVSPSSLVSGAPATEVLGLTASTSEVGPGWLFVAIQGAKKDGHDFISDALSKGACALVVENLSKVPAGVSVPVYVVENARESLDALAAEFYGNPSRSLSCYGVTGTNGKTSVTYLLEWILNSVRIPTGVLGTINHHFQEKVWPSEMTTPDPISLQRRLGEMKAEGARAIAMEVSSHALDQFRADGVDFNTVIFTNLTRDHLDYHKTMRDYFQAKQRLFTDLLWKTKKFPPAAIINIDDPWGRRLRVANCSLLITYGHAFGSGRADFKYRILEQSFSRISFELATPFGKFIGHLPMCGLHNVANAVAVVAAVAITAGIPVPNSLKILETFPGVPGRMQFVPNTRSLNVLVDYAHSPDALENVLKSLRAIQTQKIKSDAAQIWVIFGCGGDRDSGKRPIMVQVACRWADQVMVTSDNPRTENPQKIIDEIMAGVPPAHQSPVPKAHQSPVPVPTVRSQVDRRMAIQEVIQLAKPNDVILIAGKGHEDYQILGEQKIHFSDFETAEELLK